MKQVAGESLERVDALVTALCTTLSLVGSLLVIFAYYIAKSRTNPRAAQLIRNLALADFVWFLSVFIESIFWLFTGPEGEVGTVPQELCYVLSPLISISRISSLMWTCVIAFDVLQSVTKRSWFLSQDSKGNCNYRYLIFVYFFALPGAIASIIVHSTGDKDFGCAAGYEKLGVWYQILVADLFPILLGFGCNLYVFWKVRLRMAKRAFPLSVRKRRRRVMFNYIRVCMLCWVPMIVFYFLIVIGVESPEMEVVSRGLLYLTGFFNFLVFGMQDIYLKRSMQLFLHTICCGFAFGTPAGQAMLHDHLEKTVMFADENKINADVIKDKKWMYRNHRLSREDKQLLYRLRPDLNIKGGDYEDQDSNSDGIIGDGSSATPEIVAPPVDERPVKRPKSPPPPNGRKRPMTPKCPNNDTLEWETSSVESGQFGDDNVGEYTADFSPLQHAVASDAKDVTLPVQWSPSKRVTMMTDGAPKKGLSWTESNDGKDPWPRDDPNEALLPQRGNLSTSKHSKVIIAPDSDSSDDLADEEDNELLKVIIASVQRSESRNVSLGTERQNDGRSISTGSANNIILRSTLESSTRDSNESAQYIV